MPDFRITGLLLLALLISPAAHAIDNPLLQSINGLKQSVLGDELLPAEQAFQFSATVKDAHTLHVSWLPAEGYYLYREKLRLTVVNSATTKLGSYQLPHGESHYDEAFGAVEIFHQEIALDIPLIRTNSAQETLVIHAKYQGCADRGVCYPPIDKDISLTLPATAAAAPAPLNNAAATPASSQPAESEQDQIIRALHQDSFALTLASFFGFGLLLAFTPCIFPMIPILSGIIVGHGQTVSIRKAFWLSFSYVLASALMYTAFGILAALFGNNLQATFQQPWVIGIFSSIFIALSLSMFGFYHLEMPKSIQGWLHNSSDKHRDGSYLGAAMMGAFSSLIVGPCVAAPLAAALIYIGQTGDVVLGGSALFMMGLGMGLPLLIVGASAGTLLPKAGEWMNTTKAVFGVVMLAVAVWMLDRILPARITLLLWAMLLVMPSIYLGALEPLPAHATGWRKLWKGLGVMMLILGVLQLIGLSAGNSNPLQPLQGLGAVQAANPTKTGLNFQRIKTVAELEQKIQQAKTNGQMLMLDFYADWCISCKEMESYTFTDPRVHAKLSQTVLVQADVTANSADDQALLQRFNLVGPPGIIFFGKDGLERNHARVIGYQDADTFLKTLETL